MHKLAHQLPHKDAQSVAHTHYPYKGVCERVQCVQFVRDVKTDGGATSISVERRPRDRAPIHAQNFFPSRELFK